MCVGGGVVLTGSFWAHVQSWEDTKKSGVTHSKEASPLKNGRCQGGKFMRLTDEFSD